MIAYFKQAETNPSLLTTRITYRKIAGGDPFEASVARLWRSFVAEECDPPLVREGGYALYPLRTEMGPTALAAAGGRPPDE